MGMHISVKCWQRVLTYFHMSGDSYGWKNIRDHLVACFTDDGSGNDVCTFVNMRMTKRESLGLELFFFFLVFPIIEAIEEMCTLKNFRTTAHHFQNIFKVKKTLVKLLFGSCVFAWEHIETPMLPIQQLRLTLLWVPTLSNAYSFFLMDVHFQCTISMHLCWNVS